ncbi:MAG: hypothetical protein AB7T38_09055 [Nitrospirales bacterium]
MATSLISRTKNNNNAGHGYQTEVELTEMRTYLPTFRAGRYQLDRQGFLGPEGQRLDTSGFGDSINLNKLKQAQLSGNLAASTPYGGHPPSYQERHRPSYPYGNQIVPSPQQGAYPPPLSRSLPKIEPPPGWNSQYDSSEQTTKFIPPNLPQNREVMVVITNPLALPNPYVSAERIHEAAVLDLEKSFKIKGYRTERPMTRRTGGIIPLSIGVYLLPEGVRVWITYFSLRSAAEFRGVLFLSDGEDLQKVYLPMVRAMLGD